MSDFMERHFRHLITGRKEYTEAEVRLLIEQAQREEREVILSMLKGIDRTETEDPDGWWETSAGADFGAGILAAIRARGQA